jgi:hypothetical protein
VSRQRPENNGVGSKFSKKKKERGITFFLSQFSSASNWATRQTWADTVETRPRQACIERSNGPMRSTAYSVPTVLTVVSAVRIRTAGPNTRTKGKKRETQIQIQIHTESHRRPPHSSSLLPQAPGSSRGPQIRWTATRRPRRGTTPWTSPGRRGGRPARPPAPAPTRLRRRRRRRPRRRRRRRIP